MFHCFRSYLLNVYQNAPRNALKYLHESAFPPKPKKPQTAFLLYLNHVRSKFIQENPSIRAPEIVKKASEKWAELDPMEKEDFRKQYNQNYEVYVQELKAYNDSLTDEQKQLIQKNKEKSKETIDKQVNMLIYLCFCFILFYLIYTNCRKKKHLENQRNH